jgi:YVTN family beta-propeller protein
VALGIDVQSNHVFVANLESNSLSMLNARTGVRERSVRVGAAPNAVAVDPQARQVFVANSHGGTVSTLDAQSGSLMHTTPVGYDPIAVGVDARVDHVFVATYRGMVALLDPRRGLVVHRTRIGGVPTALAVDDRVGRVFVASAQTNQVTTLDALSGRIVRIASVGALPTEIQLDERARRVMVTSEIGRSVTFLDASSGSPVRTVSLPGNRIPRRLALSTRWEHVFVVLDDAASGDIVMLDARTGRRLRVSRTLPTSLGGMAIVDTEDRLYVQVGAGVLEVLDARNLGDKGSVSVPGGYGEMLVNEQNRRLFVAHISSETVSTVDTTR